MLLQLASEKFPLVHLISPFKSWRGGDGLGNSESVQNETICVAAYLRVLWSDASVAGVEHPMLGKCAAITADEVDEYVDVFGGSTPVHGGVESDESIFRESINHAFVLDLGGVPNLKLMERSLKTRCEWGLPGKAISCISSRVRFVAYNVVFCSTWGHSYAALLIRGADEDLSVRSDLDENSTGVEGENQTWGKRAIVKRRLVRRYRSNDIRAPPCSSVDWRRNLLEKVKMRIMLRLSVKFPEWFLIWA